ncbi:multidrug effflux MFS transporter [Streptomyces sp. NPDC089919]|uniref:multidrug effflux MFS transporter n=1 Tax=Streptomyces sp. NPDC089919 TaxID=3155188 RepID=UPI00343FFFED
MSDTGPAPGTTATAASAAPARGPGRRGLPQPAGPPGTTAARRTGLLVTFLLGALSAITPLTMDMYLPALPEITDELASPAAAIQLTLTACLAGTALGQLVVGPLSDRYGRRRPLLAGLAGYVLASLACAVAPSVGLLIGCRLAQGLAGSATIVIARACVRDLYDGMEMARFFSTLLLISGAAPVIAPLIGGQLMRFAPWRAVFLVLAAFGVLLALAVWRLLAETLPPERRNSGGPAAALRTMRGLLRDRVFTGYMLAGGFTFATIFSYITASPFVMQEVYGASPQAFSLLFGLNAVGLIIAGQVNGKLLVGRVPLDRLLSGALLLSVAATTSLVLLTTGVFGSAGLVPVAASLFVMMSAMGVALPNTNALAMMHTPHAAGSASALLGTAQFLVGAAASPLVGLAGEGTAVPMAVVQLSCALAAAGCLRFLCRPAAAGDTAPAGRTAPAGGTAPAA